MSKETRRASAALHARARTYRSLRRNLAKGTITKEQVKFCLLEMQKAARKPDAPLWIYASTTEILRCQREADRLDLEMARAGA